MAYKFPEKIFPTALNKYFLCPFRFKCHNDKDIKAEYVETPENFMGNVIHAVLRDFFDIKKIPLDERKNQDISSMVRVAWARMEKSSWNKEYWSAEERKELFGSTKQERTFGLKAISILNNYLTKADLSVVPLILEDWLDCDIDEFKIGGKIDRIDQDSEFLISIWDYKTGKLPFWSNIEKIIEEDVQLPFYAIMASRLYPFVDQVRAGLIYLQHFKVYEITWNRKEIKDLEKKMIKTLKKVKDDKNLFPKINKLCSYCEYLNVCPKKEEIIKNNKKIDEVAW